MLETGISHSNSDVSTLRNAFGRKPRLRRVFSSNKAYGFYEWKRVLGGKIPYSIQMKDGAPFAFAGLWEGWKSSGSEEWLHTCAIVTGEPNELVREIHTRMPVILPEEHHDVWLSGEAGKEILVPFPAERMKAWAISPRVNSPRNNDETILDPIAVDAQTKRTGVEQGG